MPKSPWAPHPFVERELRQNAEKEVQDIFDSWMEGVIQFQAGVKKSMENLTLSLENDPKTEIIPGNNI